MVKNLDGKMVSSILMEKLKIEYDEILKNSKRRAGIAFIIIGNNEASKIYVRNKEKKCSEMNIFQKTISLSEDVKEEELIEIIEKLNSDENIDGILLQLPIPKHLDYIKISSKILPNKDVDGFNPLNIGKLFYNDILHMPCTPMGILELLGYYNIEVKSKNVVILGRSNIVGKPLTIALINKGATVQTCNSLTLDLREKTRKADILISAIGKAQIIDSSYIKNGSIIIDVGISKIDNKIFGDVDYNDVITKLNNIQITPVPGGIGPMTIYSLIKNVITSYKYNLIEK